MTHATRERLLEILAANAGRWLPTREIAVSFYGTRYFPMHTQHYVHDLLAILRNRGLAEHRQSAENRSEWRAA